MEKPWLEKLAAYLDSFNPKDANYDYVCYIKDKLAEGEEVAQNADTTLDDADITTSNTEGDEGNENYEGKLMDNSFKDLARMNQEDEAEEQAKIDGPFSSESTTTKVTGPQQAQKKASLYDVLVGNLNKTKWQR